MNIEVKNIRKSFGKKVVLKDVSFSCHSGQCIGILGENGSGKSTLFGVLTGLQKGKGSFLCDGRDLLTDTNIRSKLVGFVPQNPPLINELTGIDNLRLWYSPSELKNELKNGIPAMLGIGEFAKTTVSKMSGGMKKRLSIACSVAHKPSILFLDEPSAALDILCKENITAYLKGFTQAGGIVIIATHDIYELDMCDKLYILKDNTLKEYNGTKAAKELAECLK